MAAKKNGKSKIKRMDRKLYEKELERLQVELVRLQEWVKEAGARIVVIFEGRKFVPELF